MTLVLIFALVSQGKYETPRKHRLTFHRQVTGPLGKKSREFRAYLPISLLKENKICFLITNNSHAVWEGGDMETESLLTASKSAS